MHSGFGPGWHLDHVEVQDEATGEDFYFPCDQWFDRREGDGRTERELPVAVRDPAKKVCQYKVTVHTSDNFNELSRAVRNSAGVHHIVTGTADHAVVADSVDAEARGDDGARQNASLGHL